jgi:hypothetical protein
VDVCVNVHWFSPFLIRVDLVRCHYSTKVVTTKLVDPFAR